MRLLLNRLLPACLLLLAAGCSAPPFDPAKWQEKEASPFVEVDKAYQPTVQALAFSPDGKYLASCHQYMGRPNVREEFLAAPPVVKIWQMDGRNCVDWAMFHIESGLMGTDNTALCFTPDGKTLSVLTKNGLLFWDVEQQSLRRSRTSEPIAMAHDAKTVAQEANRDGSQQPHSNGGDGISIVDGETGETSQLISPRHAQVCPWCFSPDGRRLLVECFAPSSKHEAWEIWDLPDGRRQCSVAADNAAKWPCGFSPDGRTLAMVTTANDASKATLYDAATGRQKATLWENVENLRCLAFSPDGRWVAIGCGQTEGGKKANAGALHGQLRLWDLKQGKEYASLIDRSSWGITALTFSPDGKTLATGDGDGNIRFWEITRLKNASDPQTPSR